MIAVHSMKPRNHRIPALVLVATVASVWLACSATQSSLGDARPADLSIATDGAGNPSNVVIRYDRVGVPHIECEAEDDCYWALGYAHAAYRFYAMDRVRRSIRGRAATLLGDTMIDQDVSARHYLTTADGRQLEDATWQRLQATTRHKIEAYSEGVNRWLQDVAQHKNGARLDRAYEAAYGNEGALARIPRWDVLDSVAVGLALLQGTGDLAEEAVLATAAARLPPELFDALFTTRTLAPTTVIPPPPKERHARRREGRRGLDAGTKRLPLSPLPVAAQRRLLAHRRHLRAVSSQVAAQASNNWVVSGAKTKANVAYLANDPHAAYTNPPLTMFVTIRQTKASASGRLHLAGASIPGLPLVVIGNNESVAWGITTSFVDLTDYYIETPTNNGASVRFGDADVAVVRRPVVVKRKDGSDYSVMRSWIPHHGPVVFEDNTTMLSVRWVGHEPTDELSGLFALQQAQTVAAAQQALARVRSYGGNMVLADRSGAIGWRVAAAIPARPWASMTLRPWLPLPGDGRAEWRGWLRADALPQLNNPPHARIVTANNDLSGTLADGDPLSGSAPYWQASSAAGLRAQRITELIDARNDHDLQSLLQIQGDTRVGIAPQMVPALLKISASGKMQGPAREIDAALREWRFTCPSGMIGSRPVGPVSQDPDVRSEAVGCTAFHALFYALIARMLDDELQLYDVQDLVTVRIFRVLYLALVAPDLLPGAQALWDDRRTAKTETKAEIVAGAFDDAGNWLTALAGVDRKRWLWGQLHQLVLRGLPDEPANNVGPYAKDGGLFAVNVSWPSPGIRGFAAANGAHLRWIVELAPAGIRAAFQLAGGQNLDESSAHHDDLIPAYLHNQPHDLSVEESEIESTLTLSR